MALRQFLRNFYKLISLSILSMSGRWFWAKKKENLHLKARTEDLREVKRLAWSRVLPIVWAGERLILFLTTSEAHSIETEEGAGL